jgi:hypothetical protein
MATIKKIDDNRLPFDWIDLNYLPNSMCFRKEVYLKGDLDKVENLALLFYSLFGKIKEKLIISNGQWGDFCIETWNINLGEYNYNIENKSNETAAYISLLTDSRIEVDYNGYCVCKNWDKFLSVILLCIINHTAPFSPLFYNIDNELVFYFHHTGSIGLLYKTETTLIKEIFTKIMADPTVSA